MEEEKYFNRALSDLVSDVAYKQAVRHLYDKGFDAEQIQKQLTYPTTPEQIREVIKDYERDKRTGRDKVKYVEDVDSFGRISFRQVKEN